MTASYADYIAGWNVGYWNGRMDALNGAEYRTRDANDPVQAVMMIIDGELLAE